MSRYTLQVIAELADRCFVSIAEAYELTILHTDEGLIVDVYPVTRGEVWDAPFTSFTVGADEVRACEGEFTECPPPLAAR